MRTTPLSAGSVTMVRESPMRFSTMVFDKGKIDPQDDRSAVAGWNGHGSCDRDMTKSVDWRKEKG